MSHLTGPAKVRYRRFSVTRPSHREWLFLPSFRPFIRSSGYRSSTLQATQASPSVSGSTLKTTRRLSPQPLAAGPSMAMIRVELICGRARRHRGIDLDQGTATASMMERVMAKTPVEVKKATPALRPATSPMVV